MEVTSLCMWRQGRDKHTEEPCLDISQTADFYHQTRTNVNAGCRRSKRRNDNVKQFFFFLGAVFQPCISGNVLDMIEEERALCVVLQENVVTGRDHKLPVVDLPWVDGKMRKCQQ